MSEIAILPPSDIELEKAILGAILIEKDAIYQALTLINKDSFYHDSHKEIYSSILELHKNNEPIDILTVTNDLRQKNKIDKIGGAYYISKLTSNIGASIHLEDHCRLIYELFLKRETLFCLQKNINKISGEKDVFEIYNEVSAEMSNLFELSLSSDYFQIGEVISKRLNEISKIDKQKAEMIGIDTGFSRLNSITNGFQGSDYIILGARPSMGKTIISLLSAKAALFSSKKKVLYFSLEMAKERISDRLLSIEANIDSKKIASNKLTTDEWKLLSNTENLYNKQNFFIIDKSSLSIEDIKARAITLHRKFDIGMIIIDYIQIIKYSFHERNANANENVTHISQNIKALAKDLKCPVIALSQLKRNENRPPVLSDLRNSGSLEQDADIVWFLHREDYEDRECQPEESKRIENIIAKNRNGSVGRFYSYRSDDWSYIGEIPYADLQSMTMPVLNDFDYDKLAQWNNGEKYTNEKL